MAVINEGFIGGNTTIDCDIYLIFSGERVGGSVAVCCVTIGVVGKIVSPRIKYVRQKNF